MESRRSTVIKAESILFSDLFHDGFFEVPRYQRSYDWSARNVEQLLRDVENALVNKRDHYFLGTVLLIEKHSNVYEINDGQQRMVTISLIFAALCRRFFQESPGSQREGLALRTLFALDGSEVYYLHAAETYRPRIRPPVSDSMPYRQVIRGHSIGSNGTLTTAWRKIEQYFDLFDSIYHRQFFDFLHNKLEISCLRIPRHSDANSIFETLNCRGKQLSDFDLFRNFIYSHFHADEDGPRVEYIHDNLERIREVFGAKSEEYARCWMQCKFGFIPKKVFYETSKSKILDHFSSDELTSGVFSFVESLSNSADMELFRTLISSTPDPDFVNVFLADSGTKKSVRNLPIFLRELRGYKITQPLIFVLLLKYLRETNGTRRRKISKQVALNLNRLTTFVLRTAFVAQKFEPSHFEKKFSDFAALIYAHDDIPSDEFKRFLLDCDRLSYSVLDNSRFVANMADTTLTGTTKIFQFLLGICHYFDATSNVPNEQKCFVEYILPASSEQWNGWPNFSDPGSWIDRVGNLTLLSIDDNTLGRKYGTDFQKKRDVYKLSSITITRELATVTDWTPEHVECRQRQMAHTAAKVWSFE